MKNKGQSGVIIIVVIIIIVGVFFLYKGGYLNFKSSTTTTTTQNINPYLPISFNVSAVTSLSHLYTGESMDFISNVFNNGKSYLNVTLSPYGCSFLPVQSKSFLIPPDSPSSSTWTFSSSSPTSCSITFSACFNAVSYTNYPLTIENYNFSGSVPISSITSSSGLPISLGLELSNTTIIASPVPSNQSEYIEGSSLTSIGSTSKLNWVYIHIKNGKGYFTSSTGSTYAINPSINISSSEYSLNFQYGRLLAPIQFSLVVNPISNSIGYSSDTSINVSAGYTYCLTSNSIPITISSS
ncbi:MAG: hypothetical protein OH338_03090 [Candidatus Parvarchaeota archaeon]|nr:hypothetical protein [Candidatus Parvarchaeota archaeon]MCW1295637.1 hypothetical protein [Candidatus Parvarchaeum tengchongense]MCW1298725.1 hypothetical protein [Candidatus Parvarchaeum tengchongense]MCW1312390.1 hypothetical protein [Candidatus Parvarchaeum tengchongense]